MSGNYAGTPPWRKNIGKVGVCPNCGNPAHNLCTVDTSNPISEREKRIMAWLNKGVLESELQINDVRWLVGLPELIVGHEEPG